MELVQQTMRALAFLSRLPVSGRWFNGYDGALHDTVRGFPLAGIIIALPASIVLLISALLDLPHIVDALLTIAALILTSGALHEDGLADVADGFYGGNTVETRLSIMKDSSIGSYGTLALIVSVFIRTALLTAVLDGVGAILASIVVIGTEAASRGTLVKFWQSLPSARAGGVADRAGTPKEDEANAALATGAVILAIGYGIAGGLLAVTCAILLTGVVFYGFAALCREKIGGQTGDTLGAVQQLATISLLLGLVIAL
jgi:adenosylcobinamide-GDP ribazoletransferase